MNQTIVIFVILLGSFAAAAAQQQVDAATVDDIQQMMQITGTRDRLQVMLAGMAQQAARHAAEVFQQNNPGANMAEVQKAAQAAGERAQAMLRAMPVDEMMQAMVPVYQKHLTHSDVKAILDFYSSPTGRKLTAESNSMMMEGMQAASAVVQKHMPEIEAQADKAAQQSAAPAPTNPAPTNPAPANPK